jgi:hypothetical protein
MQDPFRDVRRSFAGDERRKTLKWLLAFFSFALVSAPSLLAQSHQLKLTTGYNYQNSDQRQGVRASLQRCFADLQYDLSEHAAITGEADTYYGSSQRESLQQNFILGPQFTFQNEEAKLRPFLYDQSGVQRSSSAGTNDYALIQSASGGWRRNSSCETESISDHACRVFFGLVSYTDA